MTIVQKLEGELPFDEGRLRTFIEDVLGVEEEAFANKVVRLVTAKESVHADHIIDLIIKTALENVDEVGGHWSFVAAKAYLQRLYKQASKNRGYETEQQYGSFYELQKELVEKGVYNSNILDRYSREEIEELSKIIQPERDLLFNYIGLYTLATRYLAKGYSEGIYELPQERWLTIAMTPMSQEKNKVKRLELVKESYWALSNLYMTVATPTLANAGMSYGQLSSCFIDTVDDSLVEIYNSNTDVARLSKSGGGIGVYMGKVRGQGALIRGFRGKSSGILPWIKQLNNTAVSVDQLGTRKGAIAVYVDVWHIDTLAFLDLRLNNGDERKRSHDIYTGVALPDLFMEAVEGRKDWYLFDPHDVKQFMGWKDDYGNPLGLEDYYDEKRGDGTFRKKYREAIDNPLLPRKKVPALQLMARIMKSQLETGTPFMFYRDEANRMNPNKRFRKDGSGITLIYSSNLCTEIMQNMSPTILIEEILDEATGVITKNYQAGDFVVCNLSSINLGKAVPDNVLERLIPIQVRMLDNVIDENTIEVLQAQHTNKRYRGIGLGTFGWHHLLALKGIHWETEEAVDYADKLYEKINFLAITASADIAKEKGAYPLFEQSEWKNGNYFELRDYRNDNSELDWDGLRADVTTNGIRNGYLLAVAPNGSTSVLAGSTASVDPIFKPFYYEEKKDYKLPVVAPDLDPKTYDVYRKSAYIVDQRWSVAQQSKRQRHIDQSVSFNIYVPKNIKAGRLLEVHMKAWKGRLKSTYYVRSTTSNIEECVWCQG